MSSFRPRLASLVVRQALLFTGLAAAAMLAVAIILIGVARAEIEADLLHTVDTDIAGLADGMAVGGIVEVGRRIRDRIALDPADQDPPVYFLSDPQGRRIAGNLATLPRIDARMSAVGRIPAGKTQAIARATRLRSGVTLVVGRSLMPVDRLARRLWRMFGIALAALTIAALVVAGLVADRLRRRLATLNDTFDRFSAGDLAARVGEVRQRDEIGALATHVDANLARVQQLFHTQRQISDDIAHELRTPLVHLDGRLLRALEAAPGEAVAAELEAARSDVRSVVSLFDALLDIALAEADGAATLGIVDLSEIAGSVVELYAASVEEAGLQFEVRIAPGVTLQGEPMQLARLIANLFDNALKYVPAGSRLRFEIAAGPRIIVEDDGPGVPPKLGQRIFERFARAPTPGGGAGHGLGLALVRVIAVRHGLAARVEDARPGARFVVERKADR